MQRRSAVVLAVAVAVLAGCNPFHRTPAVEVSAKDTNLNTRWHGTLSSPAELAGAVQMNGTASMAPGVKRGSTEVTLSLANATDGGEHPWQVHHGQCGNDEGVFGTPAAYQVAKVGSDGRALSNATVELETPLSGNYYVMVNASAGNPETTVACGNLAPPTP
jgi:hypothetical protein